MHRRAEQASGRREVRVGAGYACHLRFTCARLEAGEESTDSSQDELKRASAFGSAEKRLLSVFDDRAQRGGDTFSVPSTSPIRSALQGYVAKAYADDADSVNGYAYKVGSGSFNSDTSEAGTVSNALAWSVISGDLSDATKARQAKAKAAFDDLAGMGAVFGYDAGQQSGCAAPTDFLLVIDAKGKKVYTIELTPCDES